MSPSPLPKFSLRPAIDTDQEKCYQIHRATMQEVITQIWGWDESLQQSHFTREWDIQETQVVIADDSGGKEVIIGSINLVDEPESLLLSGFELDPAYQGRGIGTEILKRLQTEAAVRRVSLFLGVFVVNTRAKRLYDRMGFEEVGRDEVKIKMRWVPRSKGIPFLGADSEK